MKHLRSWAPIGIFLAAVWFCALFAALGFRLNLTPSLPLGLYRFVPEPIERGALVAACLPLELALEGRRRGYLSRGGCPGGVTPALKLVGAAGGDVVVVRSDGVFVGGVMLQAAAPREDSRGRPLEPIPFGEYRLASQELWLFTIEPRSWDSRFYGPLSASTVLGCVRPVWTLGAAIDPTPIGVNRRGLR